MGLDRDLIIILRLTEARGRLLLRKPLIDVIEAGTHDGRGDHLTPGHRPREHEADGGVRHVARQGHGETAVSRYAAVLAIFRGQVDLARPRLDPDGGKRFETDVGLLVANTVAAGHVPFSS